MAGMAVLRIGVGRHEGGRHRSNAGARRHRSRPGSRRRRGAGTPPWRADRRHMAPFASSLTMRADRESRGRNWSALSAARQISPRRYCPTSHGEAAREQRAGEGRHGLAQRRLIHHHDNLRRAARLAGWRRPERVAQRKVRPCRLDQGDIEAQAPGLRPRPRQQWSNTPCPNRSTRPALRSKPPQRRSEPSRRTIPNPSSRAWPSARSGRSATCSG